jgi:hypothetical protein
VVRTGLSIVWLIFAGLFFVLGWAHWSDAGKSIPPFNMSQRELQKPGSGLQVDITMAGTALDKPLQAFAQDFNAYLSEQNHSSGAANWRAAWGYFLAAGTALVSALLEWREHIGRLME